MKGRPRKYIYTAARGDEVIETDHLQTLCSLINKSTTSVIHALRHGSSLGEWVVDKVLKNDEADREAVVYQGCDGGKFVVVNTKRNMIEFKGNFKSCIEYAGVNARDATEMLKGKKRHRTYMIREVEG